MRPTVLLPLKRKCLLEIFITHKKTVLGWTRTHSSKPHRSHAKHANHYTTGGFATTIPTGMKERFQVVRNIIQTDYSMLPFTIQW
jgi:hypothetical protein